MLALIGDEFIKYTLPATIIDVERDRDVCPFPAGKLMLGLDDTFLHRIKVSVL
jgi:hypothetical protein